ncbi:hypothetical protein GALMADRAFT_247346 [Galerina marginata CBS 339.88]|uniref:Uncharacterized protein n=1 Tax=Galerina marginata (strain CBS 339.88) TaxID=685588 RepID=A0A067T1D4_GALM3|nr:hypothetical protein GALMADRAFT_247346 [Galerina marginata CBS 339.88]
MKSILYQQFECNIRHVKGPTCPPSIENHVHEGQNVIQFIQLAGMAGVMFGLFATEAQERRKDPPNFYDPEFLPLAEAGEAVNTIGMTPGTVTVSQIDSSS